MDTQASRTCLLACAQMYLAASLLLGPLPASRGCPGSSALGLCSVVLESAPKALQRDVGFTRRKASYTSSPSAVEEVEFSISVWTEGLALLPPALPRWSWRCCPPSPPPVPEPSERGHRAVPRGQAGTILFLLQLDLSFSVFLGGGIDMTETFLTLGWEL